jgi:hypothetical protein
MGEGGNMANEISCVFYGADQGYHISLNGEQVHFAKDSYECDMFIAELKGRLKIAEDNAGRASA